MIQGLNVVTNYLKSVLDFVKTHQIDENHQMDLTAIVSQTRWSKSSLDPYRHVGQLWL